MTSDYFAIIVTYNPEIERVVNTEMELSKQGFNVLIVDNGSENSACLKQAASKADVLTLGKNMGIAYALNYGMTYAKEHEAEWVLTLDQDSQVAENMLAEYLKYIDMPNVGALTPSIVRKGKRDNEGIDADFFGVETIERCPTAGFFQSIKSWEKTGGYDDWMFIDYVDYDMCMRLKINGFLIYKVKSTFVMQNLGAIAYNEALYNIGCKLNIRKLKSFSVTYNHSPLRNYYYVRNSLYYINKYKHNIDTKKELSLLAKWEMRKLCLENNRIKNLKAIYSGYKDYMKKKGNYI